DDVVIDARAGREGSLGERGVREPSGVGRTSGEEAEIEHDPARERQPEGQGVETRERDVARADHQRYEVVRETHEKWDDRKQGHRRLTRYAATASRSASERGTLGMSVPGLYRSGSASHARIRATSFGRTPAPIIVRAPTCVRSGPAVPAADVPRTAWQFTQMFARKTRSPSLPCGAGAACALSHVSNSARDCATTRIRIQACSMPQNSAHCPSY